MRSCRRATALPCRCAAVSAAVAARSGCDFGLPAGLRRCTLPALIPCLAVPPPTPSLAQGRLRLDKWQDAATGAKRTAWKITASSISKVRSNYAPGQADTQGEAAAFGGYDEPAAAAAGAAAPAPWDMPAEPAAPAGQPAGGLMTAEEKWMDYFENPSREWGAGGAGCQLGSMLRLRPLLCCQCRRWRCRRFSSAAAAAPAAAATVPPGGTASSPPCMRPLPRSLQSGGTTAPTSATPRLPTSRRRAAATVSTAAAWVGSGCRQLCGQPADPGCGGGPRGIGAPNCCIWPSPSPNLSRLPFPCAQRRRCGSTAGTRRPGWWASWSAWTSSTAQPDGRPLTSGPQPAG